MKNYFNVEPEYFGTNIIRYENFLYDFNILMTDQELNWTVTETISYLIKKYELINFCSFNKDSYNFLFETYWSYYRKYSTLVNEKKDILSTKETDMSLLLKLKK